MKQPTQYYRALPWLIGSSVAILIISNIASVKITSVGPAVFDAGTILFPLAYIIGDIITEVYGYVMSRKVVLVGFASLLLMSAVLLGVQHLPIGPGYGGQDAFNQTLGFVPRIVLASLTAYMIGQLLNITVMARMRARDGNKRLWQRLISSSAIGELVDTLVFSTIAFAGTLPGHVFVTLILTVYLIKFGFDLIASPFEIRLIAWIRRLEGIKVTN